MSKPLRNSEESSRFEMPKAPPPLGTPMEMLPVVASGERSASSDVPDPRAGAPNPAPNGTERAEQEQESSKGSAVSSTNTQLVPWIIVALLVCVVIALLPPDSRKDIEPPRATPSPAAPARQETGGASGEQSNVRAMQAKVNELSESVRRLEGQIESERLSFAERLKDVSRHAQDLEQQVATINSENDKLKRERQAEESNQKNKTPVAQPLPERKPETEPPGVIWRIVALRPGDALNLRAGPGTQHAVVARLSSGARISVTGAAVPNGPDKWVPCTLGGEPRPPAKQVKGWINELFIERVHD